VARQNPVSVETVQVRLGRRASFPTYEILAGEQCHSGTCRPTNKLAIVAHPLHGGQFKDTPEHRAAYSMLHRILIEAGWNVLAFEANRLSAGGDGEVETAKLRAVITHVSTHRKFRYCKVAVLAMGVGASAAIKYVSSTAFGTDDLTCRLVGLSASQPSGEPSLLAHLEHESAPCCQVPIFWSHLDDAAHAALPLAMSATLRARGVDTESLAVPVAAIPTYGTTQCFQTERLLSMNAQPLIHFLDRAAAKMSAWVGAPTPTGMCFVR